MSVAVPWKVAGVYFEACNCESVCPCYSGQPPTYDYCEGNCVWHIEQGHYSGISLDGLNVIMVERCNGFMRETKWQCWYYFDDRATSEQFEALKHIFTATGDGHLAKIFGNLWEVQGVERATIEVKIEQQQHRASILKKLGIAIGLLKPETGPTLCRVPNIPGVAALAQENWFDDGVRKFDYQNKNALTTTFEYRNDQ